MLLFWPWGFCWALRGACCSCSAGGACMARASTSSSGFSGSLNFSLICEGGNGEWPAGHVSEG